MIQAFLPGLGSLDVNPKIFFYSLLTQEFIKALGAQRRITLVLFQGFLGMQKAYPFRQAWDFLITQTYLQ
jgi:hypothetical protein